MQLANQRQQGNTNLECLMSIGTPPYFCKTQRGFIAELHSSHTCRPFRVLLGFATKTRKQNKISLTRNSASILAFSNQSAALPSALDTHKQNSLLAKGSSQTNSMLSLFLLLGQQHIMGA
jgi:hypothetical protein